MADAAADAPPVRLVVGLGNPGAKYARTRHNAGQRVVQELALCLDAGRFATRYAGHYAEAHGPSGPVALLIPATYMNDSGSSVGPAAGTLHAAARHGLWCWLLLRGAVASRSWWYRHAMRRPATS